METIAAPVRLLHALSGILLAAALLGRWVSLQQAERSAREQDLSGLRALLRASAVFERIVVPLFSVVFVLGLVTAWLVGYPVLGFIQGGGPNWILVAVVLYVSIFPLVPIVFLPKGRVFGAALDESTAEGRITAGLLAAFRDPVTRAAHAYELTAIVLVLVLMIAKPF